mmetsp:Transcript_16086/g.31517  ORF Transcript_16086/g.31517 Transcript_16086/m.31517 type:complete len:205 (+) Transcript_16086:854-1468(+)
MRHLCTRELRANSVKHFLPKQKSRNRKGDENERHRHSTCDAVSNRCRSKITENGFGSCRIARLKSAAKTTVLSSRTMGVGSGTRRASRSSFAISDLYAATSDINVTPWKVIAVQRCSPPTASRLVRATQFVGILPHHLSAVSSSVGVTQAVVCARVWVSCFFLVPPHIGTVLEGANIGARLTSYAILSTSTSFSAHATLPADVA